MRASLRRNVTRQSASIPAKLLRSGAFHLIPVYYLLSLSDLASEGIENSGSYRFADHIYANIPSGRTVLGRWIDARLLAMPAARAFRGRYERAQAAVRTALEGAPRGTEPLRILAVPCGIPRDIAELATDLRSRDPARLSRLQYYGMDIDPAVLAAARAFMEQSPLPPAQYHLGDALAAREYPDTTFHVVVSTGLGDFLNDGELTELCANAHRLLEPGGMFYTSGSARDPRSDALLQMVELRPCYRSATQLEAILRQIPWRRMHVDVDATGLQAYVTAVK